MAAGADGGARVRLEARGRRAQARAADLAQRFGLTFDPRSPSRHGSEACAPFVLEVPDDTQAPLALTPPARSGLPALRVDFMRRSLRRRAHCRRVRSELLVRAARLGGGIEAVDATGGLGTDAWLLAAAGARVTVCEREPVIAALLADALGRAERDEEARWIAARIRLHAGAAQDVLQPGGVAEVVYLDPMYPPRRKSALGAGALRTLAALCASSREGAGLLEHALRGARERVVLKRPLKSPLPAAPVRPHRVLRGRSTRFDVWYVRDLPAHWSARAGGAPA